MQHCLLLFFFFFKKNVRIFVGVLNYSSYIALGVQGGMGYLHKNGARNGDGAWFINQLN